MYQSARTENFDLKTQYLNEKLTSARDSINLLQKDRLRIIAEKDALRAFVDSVGEMLDDSNVKIDSVKNYYENFNTDSLSMFELIYSFPIY